MAAELFDFFNRFHEEKYDFEGSPVHDPVAVAHVFRRELVQTVERHVAIDCASELCRGRTVVDLRGGRGNEPNAYVGVGIDGDAFLELLLDRLATLD